MRQRIQVVLILGMAVAAIRLGWILYERHEQTAQNTSQQAAPLNPDYYVTPKKLYPYDLKSARQLTQQPVWVKVGYAYPYYSYDSASHRASIAKEVGQLLPLQKLEIKDVVLAPVSGDSNEKQVLAVFQQDGKWYATPVGTALNGDYKFFSDDMLFIQDPHNLYKHWPADIWQQIDRHQAKPGMSELQTDFSLGIGLLEAGSDETDRNLDYPNGGNPLRVSFHDGRAIQIEPGPKTEKPCQPLSPSPNSTPASMFKIVRGYGQPKISAVHLCKSLEVC